MFLKKQWMLGKHFGYVTPGEMFSDYFKSDAIRILVVVVALFYYKGSSVKEMENDEWNWFERENSVVTQNFFNSPDTPGLPMDQAGSGLQLFMNETFGNEYFLTEVAGFDEAGVRKSLVNCLVKSAMIRFLSKNGFYVF